MPVKYIPEEVLQNAFVDAIVAHHNTIPVCEHLGDYYKPFNQFLDAWSMYCMGGEL